jgi:hypothetical protein
MEETVKLKYSLVAVFIGFLLINTGLVTMAAKVSMAGGTFTIAPDDTPMGIKWIILGLTILVAYGADMLVHRFFLEAGVSPVQTTRVDFMVLGYFILTALALLFLGKASWIYFAFFLAMLFFLTCIIVKLLLEETGRWIAWVIALIVLVPATVFTTLMIL